jgi:hypothetical protein
LGTAFFAAATTLLGVLAFDVGFASFVVGTGGSLALLVFAAGGAVLTVFGDLAGVACGTTGIFIVHAA